MTAEYPEPGAGFGAEPSPAVVPESQPGKERGAEGELSQPATAAGAGASTSAASAAQEIETDIPAPGEYEQPKRPKEYAPTYKFFGGPPVKPPVPLPATPAGAAMYVFATLRKEALDKEEEEKAKRTAAAKKLEEVEEETK